ncbi:hypothetical protein [Streptomyces sp. NPDC059783]|uniref:hypothetical protein n=1 Tax=Streptomyces sp. NPDC059783 TaxID=3346944 RepID=UPI00364637CC
MSNDELKKARSLARIAAQQAHQADANRAETEALLREAQAATLRADARAARAAAEAVTTKAALAEVRRLCGLTISLSVRTDAIAQARDTLAAIDNITEGQPLPGDAAWHSVWLHGNWSWLSKNMATPEREHAADAIQRYSDHLGSLDGEQRFEELDGLRWWRE